ncbi:MAG: hypothetical protein JW900_10715 [Anaerolineae bacterium]|nr:hypothetical protein [Anaerolineae bacterium]
MSILIHVMGEDPILAEVEDLPDPKDQFLVCENPRRRDGRDVEYVLPEVRTLILPWHRVHCLEVLPGEEEEKVITVVRE